MPARLDSKRRHRLLNLTPAVVLGLSPTGLYVVRELGRAGVPVVGVADRLQAGRASRFLAECIIEADPRRRVDKLCARFGGGEHSPVLIPTSDQDIQFVCDHADRLAEIFTMQASYRDGLCQEILDKARFYDLCQRFCVPFPKVFRGTPPELGTHRDSIAYPCFIKPSLIHTIKAELNGQKGWVARDEREFEQILSELPAEIGTLLVQEIVPGPESNITLCCTYMDRTGTPTQTFTARKLRQYPPGFGSASLVVSCPEPETRQLTERFLRAAGYFGIAAAEFKRDSRTGQLKIIEINCRPSLWFSASTAADKFLSLAAYRDLTGSDVEVLEKEQKQGIFWRYAIKDAYSAAFYLLNHKFILPSPHLKACGMPHGTVNAVFSPDDPMPMFLELFDYAVRAPRRMLSGKFGRTH
jgi:D-aspartate ligase